MRAIKNKKLISAAAILAVALLVMFVVSLVPSFAFSTSPDLVEYNGEFVIYARGNRDSATTFGAMMENQGAGSPRLSRATLVFNGNYNRNNNNGRLDVTNGAALPTVWTVRKMTAADTNDPELLLSGHYIQAPNGQYLAMSEYNGQNGNLFLRDAPYPLLFTLYTDDAGASCVRITDAAGYAVNVGGERIGNGRIASYKGSASISELCYLAALNETPKKLTYQYPNPVPGSASLTTITSKTVITTYDALTVQDAAVNYYTETTTGGANDCGQLLEYTFAGSWKLAGGEDGQTCAPGDPVYLVNGDVTLQAQWQSVKSTDRLPTMKRFISHDGCFLKLKSNGLLEGSLNADYTYDPQKAMAWEFKGVFRTDGGSGFKSGYLLYNGNRYITLNDAKTIWTTTTDEDKAALFSEPEHLTGDAYHDSVYRLYVQDGETTYYLGTPSSGVSSGNILTHTSSAAGQGTELTMIPYVDSSAGASAQEDRDFFAGSYVVYLPYFEEAAVLTEEDNVNNGATRRKVMELNYAQGGAALDVSGGQLPTVWSFTGTGSQVGYPACYIRSAETGNYLNIPAKDKLTMEGSGQLFYPSLREDGSVRLVSTDSYAVNLHSNVINNGFYAARDKSAKEWFRRLPAHLVEYRYDRTDTTGQELTVALPEPEQEVAFASYQVKQPTAGSYYYDDPTDPTKIIRHTFEGWTAGTNEYAPGDPLSETGAKVTLSAKWGEGSEEEKPYIIRYNVVPYVASQDYFGAGTTTVEGDLPAAPRPGDAPVDSANPTNTQYIISDISENYSDHFYESERQTGRRFRLVPQFKYWTADQDDSQTSVYEPGRTLSYDELRELDKINDPDGAEDREIDLYTVWSAEWMSKNGTRFTCLPAAKYSIFLNVGSAESTIFEGGLLNEALSNYSSTFAVSSMYALVTDEDGNILYDEDGKERVIPTDELLPPATKQISNTNYGLYLTRDHLKNEEKQGKYMLISYSDLGIVEADEQIRRLAKTGYSDPEAPTLWSTYYVGPGEYKTPDDPSDPNQGVITWKLSYLPSDEEVLAAMRRLNEKVVDENGKRIPLNDLTTDKYSVRWCHVKYQSASAGDGWNINAKLTRKVTICPINITFDGDLAALAAAASYGANDGDPDPTKDFHVSLKDKNTGEEIRLWMKDMTGQGADLEHPALARIEDPDDPNYSYYNYGYLAKEEDTDTGTVTYHWIVYAYGSHEFDIREKNFVVSIDGIEYGIGVQYHQYTYEQAEKDNLPPILPWYDDPLNVSSEPTDHLDNKKLLVTHFYNTYFPEDTVLIKTTDDQDQIMPAEERAQVYYKVYNVNDSSNTPVKLRYDPYKELYNVNYDESGTELTEKAEPNAKGQVLIKFDMVGTYRVVEERIPVGYYGSGTETPSFVVTVQETQEGGKQFSCSNIQIKPACGSIKKLTGDSSAGMMIQVLNRKLVDCKITKQVLDQNKQPVSNWTGEYQFAGQFLADDGTGVQVNDILGELDTVTDGKFSFTLTGTAKTTTLKVPRGLTLKLTENVSDDNYTVTYQNGSNTSNGRTYRFTIGTNTEVTCSNTPKGIDVKFKKVDGYGTALAGATFTLYTEDTCTQPYKPTGTAVTATSAANGLVEFKSIPYGTYYMKETVTPAGYKENTAVYYVYVNAGGYTVSRMAGGMIENPPDIATFGVMNISTTERRVILTKVGENSGSYRRLEDARFTIYYYDRTVVPGCENLTSNKNGVFYAGKLPDGLYLAKETVTPSGYDTSTYYFAFRVTANGVENIDGAVANKIYKANQGGTAGDGYNSFKTLAEDYYTCG